MYTVGGWQSHCAHARSVQGTEADGWSVTDPYRREGCRHSPNAPSHGSTPDMPTGIYKAVNIRPSRPRKRAHQESPDSPRDGGSFPEEPQWLCGCGHRGPGPCEQSAPFLPTTAPLLATTLLLIAASPPESPNHSTPGPGAPTPSPPRYRAWKPTGARSWPLTSPLDRRPTRQNRGARPSPQGSRESCSSQRCHQRLARSSCTPLPL